jgi:hypothetical protein
MVVDLFAPNLRTVLTIRMAAIARRISPRKLSAGIVNSPAGVCAPVAAIAPAADTPEATVAYRPGDTVRIFVTFKEPISLKNAMLRFGLQGALPAGQKVFTSFFDANALVKLSDREFELTGKIGEHVATGTYQLGFINATDDADFTRNFNAGQDFPVITISVRNDRRVEFPDIKTIRVAKQPASKP